MIIAIPYENGNIFQHFGRTEQFKFYEAENGEIQNAVIRSTDGKGHGELVTFLAANGADVLICGGIGGGAQSALAAAGIKLYGGVSGEADNAANAYVGGALSYNPDVHCDHHGHGEGHTCGSHGCGSHGEGHTCGGHGDGHQCGHGEGHSCGGHN